MKPPVPHKTVPSRDTSDGIQHDFRALATRKRADKSRLSVIAKSKNRVAEHGDEIRVGNFWGEIPNKDAVLFGELVWLVGGIRVGRNVDGGGSRRWRGHGNRGRPGKREGFRRVRHDRRVGAVEDLTEGGCGFGGVRECEVAITLVVSLWTIGGTGVGFRDFYADRIPMHDHANLLRVLFVHPRFEIAP